MSKTLLDAVGEFLAPIMMDHGRYISDVDPDTPVEIKFGDYVYKTTMKDFQQLDQAHEAAFDRNVKAKVTRRNKKAVGKLL